MIPALDEERSIGRVLADVPEGLVDEVIVVDNGSRDRTAAVALAAGARVVREPERGYGAACQAGIAALSGRIDIVVFLDGDYSDYPGDLTTLVAPLLARQADFVVGTRTTTRAARRALSPHQRFGNRLAVTLIAWRFGHRYSDLGPFRAIRRVSLDALGLSDRDFGWNVEMQVEAVRHHLRIEEVPVRYRARIGRSKISGTIGGTIRAGHKILRVVLRSSGPTVAPTGS